MIRFLALVGVLVAGTAVAAPETSERPVARSPGTVAGTQPVTVQPSGAITAPARSPEADAAAQRGLGPRMSLRPELRSRKIRRAARKQQQLRARGAVCGDPAIQGEVVGRVSGKISGCGLSDAVRVRSVSGVTLSQRAVIDCTTAKALKTWVDSSAKPALSRTGGGLARLRVAAHYACRTRNNRKGARISEHGKGRAIDISGFVLKNGTDVTVLKGWNARATSGALRKMHRGACGPFGTVLGPNADSYHRDHFHFDTARYRNGTYCR